jgi:hypothetical protein
VGLDPVLIAYEHHALSESLTTFLVMLFVWLLVRLWSPPDRPSPAAAWGLLTAAAVGIAGGLAPYARSNFLVLPLLAPWPILALGWSRRRGLLSLTQAALVLLLAAACVAPWVWRNQQKYGHAVFAVGLQIQRTASLWDCDALDLNQTRAYTLEQWRRIRALGYMPHVGLWPVLMGADMPEARGQELFFAQETRATIINSEAADRRPLSALHGMLVAFGNQAGLYTKITQFFGRENLRWSKPLRGEVGGNWDTNLYDGDATADTATQMREPLLRMQRDVHHLARSPNALTFNDLFFGYELTRPFVAVLFLLGGLLAAKTRSWPAAAVVLIAAANLAAICCLLGSAVDRYGVPLKPLMAIVAVYSLQRIGAHYAARRST